MPHIDLVITWTCDACGAQAHIEGDENDIHARAGEQDYFRVRPMPGGWGWWIGNWNLNSANSTSRTASYNTLECTLCPKCMKLVKMPERQDGKSWDG